jgi:hypothetical protein
MSKMRNIRQSEKSEGKRVRVPFGGPRLKLQLSDEDRKIFDKRGMVPRWFNDEGGRIERALGAGYDFVKPVHAGSLGQGALHEDGKDSESSARVSLIVSKGETVIRAYLMEISKEFYDEDQAAKETVNMAVDEALASGGAGGEELGSNKYGKGVTYSR